MPSQFKTAADGLSGSFGLTTGAGIGFDVEGLQDRENLLINSAGKINQRVYVSGTVTVGANQFTVDRWFVPTSGESLTWTDATDANYRIFNAPTSGMVQVIEASKIQTGKYVANWVGTGTLFVNGVQRFKGVAFDLTYNAATNVVVKFVGQVSKMRLERGLVPTRFSGVDLDVDVQLDLCMRFHQLSIIPSTSYPAQYSGGTDVFYGAPFSITRPMRAIPTGILGNAVGNFMWTIAGAVAYSSASTNAVSIVCAQSAWRMHQNRQANGNSPGSGGLYILEGSFTVVLTAELTS